MSKSLVIQFAIKLCSNSNASFYLDSQRFLWFAKIGGQKWSHYMPSKHACTIKTWKNKITFKQNNPPPPRPFSNIYASFLIHHITHTNTQHNSNKNRRKTKMFSNKIPNTRGPKLLNPYWRTKLFILITLKF